MKGILHAFAAMLAITFITASANAQCGTWNNIPQQEDAENAHVLYRGIVKNKTQEELDAMKPEEFNIAYDNWKKAYELAPAADGQRPSHFSDGRLILRTKYNKATTEAEKKQFAEQIMKLYDEQIKCYENEAFLLGRKAFDMFYMPEYGYRDATFQTLKQALQKGGKDSEYILLEPMAQMLVYLFKSKQVDQAETQRIYNDLEEIADHNIKENKQYGQYYDASKARMSSQFKEIEDEVFDCGYFKKKLVPEYQAKPDDIKVIQYVYVKLRQQGCDTTEAIMLELKGKYEVLAKSINDSLEIVRRQENPCYDASQLQQEGKYNEAIARYEECIASTDDPEVKAQVYYSIASIRLYRQSSESAAIAAARKALSYKPGWGRPYIIIGDAYAKIGRGCDDWNARLAIIAAIDKYIQARGDSDAAGDANTRIGQYSSSLPERQEGFMRGIKEGQSVTVGCGIGETVKVRFKD